jgi:hypothetical protein
MYPVVVAQDVIDLCIFKDGGVHHLVPIGHLDLARFLLQVAWNFHAMLDITSQGFDDAMRYGANHKIVQMLRQEDGGRMILHILFNGPIVDDELFLLGLKPLSPKYFLLSLAYLTFEMSVHLWLPETYNRKNQPLGDIEALWVEHGSIK